MTAPQRAARDCDAVLVGKTCTVCQAPATTWVTPPGRISAARVRQGDRPAERAATLAEVTDFRCDQHRKRGRSLPPDGSTYADRADADCRKAVAGQVCSRCGQPAVTAATPPGEPSFSALRDGTRPADRARILTQLTDFRCAAHPIGRPTLHPTMTTVQHGASRVAAVLRVRGCADPACDLPATGGITRPGLPNLGEIAQGDRLDAAEEALASAVVYCTAHLAARTAASIDPVVGLDPTVQALGGPDIMVLTLLTVSTLAELADITDLSLADVDTCYRRIGVDVATVLAYRRGESPTRPRPVGERLSASQRVAWLGALDTALVELAASCSKRDLVRRLKGGRDASGTVKAVARGYAAFGVDLVVYFPHRLRDYAPPGERGALVAS